MDTDHGDLTERESGEHVPSLRSFFPISCCGFPNGASDETEPNPESTRVNRFPSHMSAFIKGNRNFRIPEDTMEVSVFKRSYKYIAKHKKVTVLGQKTKGPPLKFHWTFAFIFD